MDGVDTLQSSTLETKAERIARYKEERRRELAKRYGNTEDFTSKYVRRDRKIGDSSETAKKETHNDDVSEEKHSRRETKVAEPLESNDDVTAHHTEDTKPTAALCSSETVSSGKLSSRRVHSFTVLYIWDKGPLIPIVYERQWVTIRSALNLPRHEALKLLKYRLLG